MALYAIEGNEPVIEDADVWIAPSASVIGGVVLKKSASVWFGVVIRCDNEAITIGERSNIQENSVLHTDPGCPIEIGTGCTIGHRAMIHGCTIGDNTLIGMGATILNRAKIGKNCLIGAGALIPEGKIVPDNSLVVGVPGKVIRRIDEEGEADLRRSAEIYVRNAKRFATGLGPVEIHDYGAG